MNRRRRHVSTPHWLRLRGGAGALSALTALSLAGSAFAEPRHLTANDSSVVERGENELQPLTFVNAGRERYYSRVEASAGIVHGLTDSLEGGFALNFTSTSEDVVVDTTTNAIGRIDDSEFSSMAVGFKYRLTDSVLDAVGSAVGFGSAIGPGAAAFEGVLILDDVTRPIYWGFNLRAVHGLEFSRDERASRVDHFTLLEPAGGATFLFGGGWAAGLEAAVPFWLEESAELSSCVLHAGPSFNYTDESLWVVLAVLPQLYAFAGKTAGHDLDLERHERLSARLLLGFSL